jgi:hypothetical protein
VGVGYPLEASAKLVGPIPAGTWHLVGDGIVIDPVDVTYAILWRSPAGDQTLASTRHHFDPFPAGPTRYDASLFETDLEGVAAKAYDGDSLVLRFTAESSAAGMPFIPNSHGVDAKGRIPSIRLPR